MSPETAGAVAYVPSPLFSSAQPTPDASGAVGAAAAEQARVAGFAAGWAAGSRAAAAAAEEQERLREIAHARAEEERQERLLDALRTLARAAQAVERRVLPVVEDVRGRLAAGALDLAQAVVGHVLASPESSAAVALARATAVPADLGVHTVRLSPADLDALHSLPALAPLLAQVSGIELVADPALQPGDAISVYPDGYLDARIRETFERAHVELALTTHDAPAAVHELPTEDGGTVVRMQATPGVSA